MKRLITFLAVMVVGVSIFPHMVGKVDAAVYCECTNYVANRFNLSPNFPMGYDWNNGYLQNQGYVTTTVKPGVIVVMETTFPGSPSGHVGVVESYNSANGQVTVRGANQWVGSDLPDEYGCNNVRITTFATSIVGRSDVTFWEHASLSKREYWQKQNGRTSGNITNVAFNNKYYQFVRAADEGTAIYQRSLITTGGDNFTSWSQVSGQTASDVVATSHNGRLYILVRGATGRIFVRSTADGVFSDDNVSEGWVEIKGLTTTGNPQIASVEGNLYVTARKNATEEVYQMVTNNALNPADHPQGFDATNIWEKLVGQTSGDLTMVGHNNTLYQFLPGGSSSGRIFMRTKPNGGAFSGWTELTGKLTAGNIQAHSFSSKLYLTIQAKNESGSIYMAEYDSNSTSQYWNKQLGSTSKDVTMIASGGRLYQTVRSTGANGDIYMRSSSDANFSDLDE